jgi:hypothetical protein
MQRGAVHGIAETRARMRIAAVALRRGTEVVGSLVEELRVLMQRVLELRVMDLLRRRFERVFAVLGRDDQAVQQGQGIDRIQGRSSSSDLSRRTQPNHRRKHKRPA